MDTGGFLLIALQVALIGILARPAGGYLARVFSGEHTFLSPLCGPVERTFYRLAGIDPAREQHWSVYAFSFLMFGFVGTVLLYVLLRLQVFLPLNPTQATVMGPDMALNTALSFSSNTNWQAYASNGVSHLVQMAGLAVQNFLSAAGGLCVAAAFVRALARREAKTIGNFWVDMVRAVLYVLLPFGFVVALVFVAQGVPQTLAGFVDATTLEGARQTIPLGPVASQEAIKILGTNGGGFFSANSAHPFENPTAITNFIQIMLIFVLGAGLANMFGRMAGDERQGWALLAAMGILFVAGAVFLMMIESQTGPAFSAAGLSGSNMEGKEMRFGIAGSALFAAVTTDASCGATNALMDSLLPLGGLVPLFNMQLGDIIVGGVGAGLYGMLVFVVLTVFIAGLMVGRTPEWLGKKIGAREVKLALAALLVTPMSILLLTALACLVPDAAAAAGSAGPHGFTRMLYAFTSSAGNNGSVFAGLEAGRAFWLHATALAMFMGRFFVAVPVLALAGAMADKKALPPGPGTFPTHGPLFVGLLVVVILIVGGLTFFPALVLGPVAEHFSMAGL